MLMNFGMTCCMNQRVSKLKLLLNLQVKKQRPPIRFDYFEHLYLINLKKKSLTIYTWNMMKCEMKYRDEH